MSPALPDRHYSVSPEFCGETKPKFVARFCDDWVGKANTEREAIELCVDYEQRRMAIYA